MRGVPGQEQPALLHRLGRPDPQIEAADVAKRHPVQAARDQQPRRQLIADPLVRPVGQRVGHRNLEVVPGLPGPPAYLTGETPGM
jgi:hypothetical protein